MVWKMKQQYVLSIEVHCAMQESGLAAEVVLPGSMLALCCAECILPKAAGTDKERGIKEVWNASAQPCCCLRVPRVEWYLTLLLSCCPVVLLHCCPAVLLYCCTAGAPQDGG
jgi:hypothetical protein